MNTLAIDPGLRGVGAAYFRGPTLIYADYIKNPVESGSGPESWFGLSEAVFFKFKDLGYQVDTYVCEIPQVYKFSPGDPADLIEIAAVAAAVGAMFPVQKAYGYQPRVWKGQLKKEVHHPRILAQLSPSELEAMVEKRKSYAHNMYDAIGLGLYALERLRVRMSK